MSLVSSRASACVAALLTAIDPGQPAGLFNVEDETYQAIEQEMVKLGGLHQDTIDWAYVEEASCQYLVSQCKQFRILGYLLNAWIRSAHWDRWTDGISLLAGMVEQYWETAHPKPGPTGYLAKRRLVSLMLERFKEALPDLAPASRSEVAVNAAQQAIASLQRNAATAQLEPSALLMLERSLASQDTLDESGQIPSDNVPGPSASVMPLTESFFPAVNATGVGSDRESRRSALMLAEQINQQDIYDPTGYWLRRFSLWAHIQSAPAIRHEHCTELPPVPKEIVQGYQEALGSASVEPALLLRIEKSVVASPFWIRGSHMAASIASRLAMDEVANAIQQASERFVRRIPALLELKFSDGTAFVDEPCRAWLSTARSPIGTSARVPEYTDLHEDLSMQLDRDGIEAVLLRLQTLQARGSTPRQRCHASVMAAELLSARGLAWLADDLSANVAQVMATTSARIWEPDLYQRSAQRTEAVASLIEQEMNGQEHRHG